MSKKKTATQIVKTNYKQDGTKKIINKTAQKNFSIILETRLLSTTTSTTTNGLKLVSKLLNHVYLIR